MTDYKQLCAELVDDLELCDWPFKLKETIRADIDRARAALAEPEPEVEPTLREEFTLILNEARCNSTGRVVGNIELGRGLVKAVGRFRRAQPESERPTDEELVETVKQSMEDCIFFSELLYYNREPLMQILRAVLARWGDHPGSPDRSGNLKAGLTRSPAASEVAELVAWLQAEAEDAMGDDAFNSADYFTRAASLLQRMSQPQPS